MEKILKRKIVVIAAMLGLRMVLAWAKEVGYTAVLNLNNVTIRV